MGTKVFIDYRIFKQPNGLYLFFDTNVCCPIAYDLSEAEVMCMALNLAKERTLADIEHASDLKECKDLFAPVNITQRQFFDILRECKKPVEKDQDDEDAVTEQDLLDAKDYIQLALSVYSGLIPKCTDEALMKKDTGSRTKALRILDKLVDKELMTSKAEEFDVSKIVNKEMGGTYDDIAEDRGIE